MQVPALYSTGPIESPPSIKLYRPCQPSPLVFDLPWLHLGLRPPLDLTAGATGAVEGAITGDTAGATV